MRSFRDASASEAERLREENRRLRELAYKDPLTNLGNRHAYDESIEEAMKAVVSSYKRAHEAGLNNHKFAIVVIDMNGLHEANKRGQEVGDALLSRLADSIRDEDKAFRVGGDEFVVILDLSTTALDSRSAVSGFIKRINLFFNNTREQGIEVPSFSVGYASISEGMETGRDDPKRNERINVSEEYIRYLRANGKEVEVGKDGAVRIGDLFDIIDKSMVERGDESKDIVVYTLKTIAFLRMQEAKKKYYLTKKLSQLLRIAEAGKGPDNRSGNNASERERSIYIKDYMNLGARTT